MAQQQAKVPTWAKLLATVIITCIGWGVGVGYYVRGKEADVALLAERSDRNHQDLVDLQKTVTASIDDLKQARAATMTDIRASLDKDIAKLNTRMDKNDTDHEAIKESAAKSATQLAGLAAQMDMVVKLLKQLGDASASTQKP